MGVFPQCRCISAGIPIPWGVEKIEFNDSLLSSGLIQITQLRLWLEDGSLLMRKGAICLRRRVS
jgi:predicted component of type VI protein secretion system